MVPDCQVYNLLLSGCTVSFFVLEVTRDSRLSCNRVVKFLGYVYQVRHMHTHVFLFLWYEIFPEGIFMVCGLGCGRCRSAYLQLLLQYPVVATVPIVDVELDFGSTSSRSPLSDGESQLVAKLNLLFHLEVD